MASETIGEIGTANFETAVLGADVPVLVEFWAPWCGPCKMMAPLLEETAKVYDGQLRVGKINVDDEPALASRYQVRSIPTMMVFSGGHPAATLVGAVNRSRLETFVEAQLPGRLAAS